MQQAPEPTITKHFSRLEDPRRYNKRHQLLDILVIAVCAAVCEANSWEDVELFGNAKYVWFEEFLGLPHGIPGGYAQRRLMTLKQDRRPGCTLEGYLISSSAVRTPAGAVHSRPCAISS